MSQIGSRASKRSGVGKNSYVDESLFGDKKKAGATTATNVISLDELRTIRGKAQANQKNDAVIISANELSRIKEATTVRTADEQRTMNQIAKDQAAAAQQKSKARKAKMMEMDAQRAAKVKPTEWQVTEKNKGESLLSKAQKKMDEGLDDVKAMNQLVMYSKVVTIRDKQLEENKRLESEYLVEQKKLDMMMEIERLKVLKEEEEREAKKVVQRLKGKQVIVDQIQERTLQRMKEQEIRDQERLQLLANIEKMKREDEATAEAKRQRTLQMIKQAAEANQQATLQKEKRAKEEKDAEEEIIAYQKMKDQKEYEHQLEVQKQKDEKEKEIQRLRELQEKAADRQAEIDALRAKRAFEEGERQARERERLEHQKRQRIIADLEVARQTQFAQKQESLAEQARIEREDYMNQIQKQKQIEAQEKKIEEGHKAARIKNMQGVRSQINTKENNAKQDRLDYLEDGRKIRENIQGERDKIKGIQNSKLEELKQMGIDGKYMVELEKKTVSF